jgi:hypothetical protein
VIVLGAIDTPVPPTTVLAAVNSLPRTAKVTAIVSHDHGHDADRDPRYARDAFLVEMAEAAGSTLVRGGASASRPGHELRGLVGQAAGQCCHFRNSENCSRLPWTATRRDSRRRAQQGGVQCAKASVAGSKG